MSRDRTTPPGRSGSPPADPSLHPARGAGFEPDLAPWQEPARGGHPDPATFALTGIEQLRLERDGGVPAPPVAHLTGNRIAEIGEGTATFTMPLSDWLRSSQGPISLGPLTIPADGAMGVAVQSLLPEASPLSTSELSLTLLAPVRPGGILTARARVVMERESLTLAQADLYDGDVLVGQCSGVFFVQRGDPPAPPHTPALPAGPHQNIADTEDPDPYLRPAQGTVLGQDVWDARSGLEVLQAQIAGELPPAPLTRLTGLAPATAERGAVTCTIPTVECLTAPPPGRAHGGIVATVGEAGMMGAIQTVLPAGTAFAPFELKINYLRPMRIDGRLARSDGRLVRAGRRIAVASAEVRDSDDRIVALLSGSARVLPGRAASLADEAD